MRTSQPLSWLVCLTAFLSFACLPAQIGFAQKAAQLSEKAAVSLVNVNDASPEKLESVRGIGPALAERIVQYRKSNGGFKTLEDLSKVRGIGVSKLAKIKDQITV